MSQSATEKQQSIWPPVWLAFVLVAAVLVGRAVYNWASVPLFADTDDAMRFTVVHDLLAGQSWYDPVQHRFNTPFGAEMHWSRLVDLPIATLMLLLRPLAGAASDTLALFVWPLILLFALLALSARMTVTLAGREGLLPGLLLPALSVVTAAEFAPGRIDHHSVVIVLTLAMAYCSIKALTRPRFAIGAGVAAASALAVAIESLPLVAAAILGFGLVWALVPARAGALRSFGISFAAAALVHGALALSPDRWLIPACDALSIVYIAAAIGVGAVFTALSVVPAKGARTRLALGVIAGGALGAVLVLAFPDCLKGPYAALDPWLAERWISHVREAMPLWESFGAAPGYVVGAAVPSVLALGVVAWLILFGNAEERGEWLLYGLFLACAAVVMLVQIRGSRISAELVAPAGAWLILAARRRYLAGRQPLAAAGLLAGWIGFAGIALAAFTGLIMLNIPNAGGTQARQTGEQMRACLMESSFAELAALPSARIMTPVDLGSHVLAFTRHEVVAAPYHRNQRGVRDALQFFNLPLEEAAAILKQRGIALVVICPGMPEMKGLADAAEDSFVRLYERGELPAWLVDRSQERSPLRIYEVLLP